MMEVSHISGTSDGDIVSLLIEKPNHIRNITLIGNVDQGRSTLCDLLVHSHACCRPCRPDSRYREESWDTTPRIVFIRPLLFKLPAELSFPDYADGTDFLINLVRPPDYSGYIPEAASQLRVCDGAIIVVDAIEGFSYRNEIHIRQALTERVTPILFINKLDRAFLELQLSSEEIYQCLCRIIENVNVMLSTYQDESLGDILINPIKGNVIFGSALHGWGFTLKQFAVMYADKFGVDEDKMNTKLWDDNYFDSETKKWTTNPISSTGKTLPRAFCKFILDPIGQLIYAVMNGNEEKLTRILKAIQVRVNNEVDESQTKRRMKQIMNKWLPLDIAVLERVVNYLPSAAQAQKYRVQTLYTGPQDDITAEAIRQCDAKGPLMVYVFKLVWNAGRQGQCYAIGRVFSGTISSGQTVRILGARKRSLKLEEESIKQVQSSYLIGGGTAVSVEKITAGNFCVLTGINDSIVQAATLTSDETSYAINAPFAGITPCLQCLVEPKNPAELPKLIEGLKSIQKQERTFQVQMSEDTGELIIAAEDEILLEQILRDAQESCYNGIKVTGPIIVYKETVIGQSSQICMSKSPNKHNRLYVTAMPMEENLSEALEKLDAAQNGFWTNGGEELLVRDIGWKEEDVKKIWCFVYAEAQSSSMLMNNTNSVVNITEIKDSVCAAFQWTTKEGVLAEEGIRGVKWNLMDAVLHSDAVHRGGGQIIPTSRRAFYAAMLTAQPRLMEPVYLIEIQCPEPGLGGVYSVMNKRKGTIIEEVARPGTSLVAVKGYLPAEGVIGLAPDMRANTAGQAFTQMAFDHYQIIPDDPLVDGTRSNDIVKSIRKRKGLSADLPSLDRFLDTL